DTGSRNVTGRADRGEGRLGRKPRASSDVKDAHPPYKAGRAQNERHEVSRNMRKGSVVLGRRLPLKDEFLHTVTLYWLRMEDLQPQLVMASARRRSDRIRHCTRALLLLRCIWPLLMLWTAPPPGRKCHGCGCC